MEPPLGGGAPTSAAAAAAAAAADNSLRAGQNVRLLSWNVNGLRAALKRLNVTISQFLEGLGADIICFQETKLRRCDIDRELAVVEGWDSFFCCDTTRATGYSGTATYVRSGVALPFAAEEGFTGCAPLAAGNGGAAAAAAASVCPHPALVGHFDAEELAEMDAEGRVLVTDHGSFVLFNLYGPAITNADTAEDRSEFKLRFYRALELRWRQLLRQGRAVVAVGDFNITPAPIDYREERKMAVQEFFKSRSKLWLRRLLHGRSGMGATPLTGGPPATEAAAAAALAAALAEAAGRGGGDAVESSSRGSSSSIGGGGFVDTFRHFHPTRQSAFTCWSTATNARVHNWGSRIDLILAGGLSVGSPPAGQPAGAAGAAAGKDAAGAAGRAAGDAAGIAGRAAGDAAGRAAGDAAETRAAAAEGGQGQQWADPSVGTSSGGPYSSASPAVWVAAADIWPQQQGSDHCPVWADLAVAEGGAFPCAAAAPSTAMRFVFAGKQLKLHSWLQRGIPAAPNQASCGESSQGSLPPPATHQQQQQQAGAANGSQQQGELLPSSQGLLHGTQQSQANATAAGPAPTGSAAVAAAAGGPAAAGKKQATLKTFFQCPQQGQQGQQQQQVQQQQQGQQPPATQQPQQQQQQQPGGGSQGAAAPAGRAGSSAFIAAELAAAASSKQASVAQAKDAWRSIQQRFQQVPKCFHGEAAEQKRVNKSGPNQGRYFWRCARPAGPRPEGDCGYFKPHSLCAAVGGWRRGPGTRPTSLWGPARAAGLEKAAAAAAAAQLVAAAREEGDEAAVERAVQSG